MAEKSTTTLSEVENVETITEGPITTSIQVTAAQETVIRKAVSNLTIAIRAAII